MKPPEQNFVTWIDYSIRSKQNHSAFAGSPGFSGWDLRLVFVACLARHKHLISPCLAYRLITGKKTLEPTRMVAVCPAESV